jgi:hypothetical protein
MHPDYHALSPTTMLYRITLDDSYGLYASSAREVKEVLRWATQLDTPDVVVRVSDMELDRVKVVTRKDCGRLIRLADAVLMSELQN